MEWMEAYEMVKDAFTGLVVLLVLALLKISTDQISKRFEVSKELDSYKQFKIIAETAVTAAEQKYNNELKALGVDTDEFRRSVIEGGQKKKQYVIDFIRGRFPDLDEQLLDSMIEAAVYEMKRLDESFTGDVTPQSALTRPDESGTTTLRVAGNVGVGGSMSDTEKNIIRGINE